MVALSVLGSAILLLSCEGAETGADASNTENMMTEQSENLTIIMSENGRRSYVFKTPLLEGYTMARDPYREFRKGIDITTYKDDSLSTVNATLTANYAIYYEERKLWEAKGDVVVIKTDGTRLYTQQLFWNSTTQRIYSNVDTKIVKGPDVFYGEGFESDEEIKQWRFRRMTGRMFVNVSQEDDSGESGSASPVKREEQRPASGAKPSEEPRGREQERERESQRPQRVSRPTDERVMPVRPLPAGESGDMRRGLPAPESQTLESGRTVPKSREEARIRKRGADSATK